MSEDHAIGTLVLHGGIVFFMGMSAGLPYGVLRVRGGTPESLDNWRVAHAQNPQNGLLLLVVGACTTYVELSPPAIALMVYPLVVAAYTDMAAWLIRPVAGHTGLLPTPPIANVAAFALFSVTLVGQFIGIAVFIHGAYGGWVSQGAA